RDFAISTTHLSGSDGAVEHIHWAQNEGAPPLAPMPGTHEARPAELVLLAMGFLHPEQGLLDQLGVVTDPRGNAEAPSYATSVEGVLAAGAARHWSQLALV